MKQEAHRNNSTCWTLFLVLKVLLGGVRCLVGTLFLHYMMTPFKFLPGMYAHFRKLLELQQVSIWLSKGFRVRWPSPSPSFIVLSHPPPSHSPSFTILSHSPPPPFIFQVSLPLYRSLILHSISPSLGDLFLFPSSLLGT